MMNNLFISGGTGFWGKSFLDYLVRNNLINNFSNITVLTRNTSKFLKANPSFDGLSLKFLEDDIRQFNCEDVDFDYIIHLATDASKDLNDHHPLEMMDVILNGTKHILEFASKQKHLKRFLFASSGAVYGNIPENIQSVKEEDRFDLDFTNPINAYAQSKRTAEMMCQIYIQKYNLPIVIVRGFAFKGDFLPENAHFAYGNFIKQARENGKIIIHGDGSPIRSYMDAKDMAEVILHLLTTENLRYNTYNLGSDQGKALKEWAYQIAKENGNIEVEILNEPQKGYSAGNNYVPNVEKLRIELNTLLL